MDLCESSVKEIRLYLRASNLILLMVKEHEYFQDAFSTDLSSSFVIQARRFYLVTTGSLVKVLWELKYPAMRPESGVYTRHTSKTMDCIIWTQGAQTIVAVPPVTCSHVSWPYWYGDSPRPAGKIEMDYRIRGASGFIYQNKDKAHETLRAWRGINPETKKHFQITPVLVLLSLLK